MQLSPKERFRQTPEARQWKSAVESSWFQDGLTAAVANMMLTTTPTGNDAAAAAAAFNRLEGAKALVQTMMNLAEAPPPATKLPDHNLKPV
jgi:glutamate/tyrosine decarboxylase-like PLP-dependent enzyme